MLQQDLKIVSAIVMSREYSFLIVTADSSTTAVESVLDTEEERIDVSLPLNREPNAKAKDTLNREQSVERNGE